MTDPYTRDAMVAHMVQWFLRTFEDAAENTPYESAEGGYQYIYGDPVDTREALDEKFGGLFADEIIAGAAKELEDEHNVDMWVPQPTEEFYK
jgi:hypothetical protein